MGAFDDLFGIAPKNLLPANALEDYRSPGAAFPPRAFGGSLGGSAWELLTGIAPHPNALAGLSALGSIAPRPSPFPQLAPAEKPSRRRVFISFQFEDMETVKLLRGIAKSDQFDLDFYDESLKGPFDSRNSDYIRHRILTEHIERASVTICIVGSSTYRSEWVDWECFQSLKNGKRVIGMCPPGCTSVRYPKFFELTDAPVKLWNIGWLQASIDSAARHKPFRNP
jgi:hypothetical protein